MTEYRRPASRLLIGGLLLGLATFLLLAFLTARPHTDVGPGGLAIDRGFRPSMLLIFGGQGLVFFGLPLALMVARPKRLLVDDDAIEMRGPLGTRRLPIREIVAIGTVYKANGGGVAVGGLIGALARNADVRQYHFIGSPGRIVIDGALVDQMGDAFEELYARVIGAVADNVTRSVASGAPFRTGHASLTSTDLIGLDEKRRQVQVPLARITAVTDGKVHAGDDGVVCTIPEDPVLLTVLSKRGIAVS